MDGIVEAKLPYDIRLHIFKFYLSSWSTRIPTNDNITETNVARLEYHNDVLYIVPITPIDPRSSFRTGRQTRVALASVFKVCQSSKSYQCPLETFFFRHVSWNFTSPMQLKKIPIETLAKFKNIRLHLEDLDELGPLAPSTLPRAATLLADVVCAGMTCP